MTVFRFIPVGDLALSDKDPVTGLRKPVMLKGAAYVRQKISTHLKFFLKEWFLDQREGLPLFSEVFVQNPDLDVVRTIFRKAILSLPEVASVPKLSLIFDRKNRALAIEFDATLVTGGVIAIRQPDLPFIITLPRAA